MKKPLLLGHRGARASGQFPENTIAAFDLCLDHGCDGFEFDVRRSADGIAVICHDPLIQGLEIDKTSSDFLPLPTLQEVLHRFGARAFLDIELKVVGLERELLALLRRNLPRRGYVISSFHREALHALFELDNGIPLGYLCETAEQLSFWPESTAEWIIPHFGLVDQNLVAQIHDADKKVMVWTVNDPHRIRKLATWGADAIISDDTELLVRSFT